MTLSANERAIFVEIPKLLLSVVAGVFGVLELLVFGAMVARGTLGVNIPGAMFIVVYGLSAIALIAIPFAAWRARPLPGGRWMGTGLAVIASLRLWVAYRMWIVQGSSPTLSTLLAAAILLLAMNQFQAESRSREGKSPSI